ncbi:MAG: hypothetical protein CR982_06715 [Candidatus Cloacimonadota bacterium]|nr:MAG: hypothetical protein CR982_06715 [Candidatus Cloacimonadota bacterium]PIE77825.1 MAG: hypothetical protein CSA15_11050 [Candidatus Delongbacteria bacterium]
MALKHTFFGLAVGFILSGPIGAVLGAVLGSLVPDKVEKDENKPPENRENYNKNRASEFTYSLLILFAIVIKADNKTKKSEIAFIKSYLIKKFGLENAQEMMHILKALLQKNVEAKPVCQQIRFNTDYYFRIELIHLLFKLATIDQHISVEEFDCIKNISIDLGVSNLDFRRIASMFTYSSSSKSQSTFKLEKAYKIMGVEKGVTLEELKKSYRKLSKEYHPDRVAHLGEEYQKIAEEKFVKIKDAYDTIKKDLESF